MTNNLILFYPYGIAIKQDKENNFPYFAQLPYLKNYFAASLKSFLIFSQLFKSRFYFPWVRDYTCKKVLEKAKYFLKLRSNE